MKKSLKLFIILCSLLIVHYSLLFAQKPELVLPMGHTEAVNSVCFSPDGKYALSGSSDNTIKLWEVNTGRELRSFDRHTAEVNSVAFSSDGKYALSGSTDKTIKLWEVSTGKEIHCFRGHNDAVRSVAFSPDGKYILSGSDDNAMKLWEINTGKEHPGFEGHKKRNIKCSLFT